MSNLPKHTKIYMEFFGLEEGDFIPCEITGGKAVDVHHLYPKQMGGRKTITHDDKEYDIDAIENLMALSRDAHTDAHNEIYTKEQLWVLHKKTMRNYLDKKDGR